MLKYLQITSICITIFNICASGYWQICKLRRCILCTPNNYAVNYCILYWPICNLRRYCEDEAASYKRLTLVRAILTVSKFEYTMAPLANASICQLLNKKTLKRKLMLNFKGFSINFLASFHGNELWTSSSYWPITDLILRSDIVFWSISGFFGPGYLSAYKIRMHFPTSMIDSGG